MELHFIAQEVSILNDICDIQISSYSTILRGNLLKEDELLLLQFQSSLEDARREAKWKLSQYFELKNSPLYLGIMEDTEISTMRHILFNLEEDYLLKYPKGVTELWKKFFTIEENRNPQLLLTLKVKNSENKRKLKTKAHTIA